jgi:hypothetical protein
VSTTRHSHSGLDILTQLEPLGAVHAFSRQVDRAIPSLTTPSVTTSLSKVIVQSPTATRGVVVTYIPQSTGDPVQSNSDERFYFRSGDEFTTLPFSMLKRLFAASDSPDIRPVFHKDIVTLNPDDTWRLPIAIQNDSSAVGEHVTVMVRFDNRDACETLVPTTFRDVSALNPNTSTFLVNLQKVVHRGLSSVTGEFLVKMKVHKRAKRVLRLTIAVFANKMRAREWSFDVQLAKSGFTVTQTKERFIY